MTRSLAIVMLSLLTAGTLWAQIPVQYRPGYEQYREPLQDLLTDELVAPVELPKKLDTCTIPAQAGWPKAVGLSLAGDRDARRGYGVVDQATRKLVGFTGIAPVPPVPLVEMPVAEAIASAAAYCRRHMPELFADGAELQPPAGDGGDTATTDAGQAPVPGGEATGAAPAAEPAPPALEVTAEVAPAITPLGARMVTLRRLAHGVRTLTWAEVGVRVYDGQVVHFRRMHVPLDPALKLPGDLTLEQVKEAVANAMPDPIYKPVFWYGMAHEVAVVEGAQRNVWSLHVELKTRTTTRKQWLERIARYRVDAITGEVVECQPLEWRPELWWPYRAAGGPNYPDNGSPIAPIQFEDSWPAPTPDGQRVVFLSTRPREGYPLWMKRPTALCVINADGTGLRCLLANAGGTALATDGQRIAFASVGGSQATLTVVDFAGKELARIAVPAPWQISETLWLPDGRIAALGCKYGQEYRLLVFDPAQPETPAVELPAAGTPPSAYGGMMLDSQGRLLFTTVYQARQVPSQDERRNQEPVSLWRLDAVSAEAKIECVAEYLAGPPGPPNHLRPGPGSKMMLGQHRDGGVLVVDPQTGVTEDWQPTVVFRPAPDRESAAARGDLRLTPDGQQLMYSVRMWDRQTGKPTAALICTATPAGDEIAPLTPWASDVVPMVGE